MKTPLCLKCQKEMVATWGDLEPLRWSCECGRTARLESQREVNKVRKAGFLHIMASEGKRIMTIHDYWDTTHCLIYEEPRRLKG